MKKLTFIFFLISAIYNAQFDDLPEKLIPYKDGKIQFYKDLNTILLKNNFSPCNNRQSEMFLARIEIDTNNNAKIINDNGGQKNDCAKELFIKAFNEMNKLKKWKYIAESNGKTSILFYPIDYFDSFKEGYTVAGLNEKASFPGGIDEFKKTFAENFWRLQKQLKDDFNCEISFKIDNFGNMFNIKVMSKNPKIQIEKNFVLALKQIETKWSPEKFRGNPIISNYRMPINIKLKY